MYLTRRHTFVVACGAAASAAGVGTLLDGAGEGPPTRGRGEWTSFGTLALLHARPAARPTVHLRHASPAAATHAASAGHGWSQLVRLDIEVHNGLRRPVLFSPGQLRLRVGQRGPTVTPYDAQRPAGPLGAGSTTRTWVSYLVPGGEPDLRVEFSDLEVAEPLVMAVHVSAAGETPAHLEHAGVRA